MTPLTYCGLNTIKRTERFQHNNASIVWQHIGNKMKIEIKKKTLHQCEYTITRNDHSVEQITL